MMQCPLVIFGLCTTQRCIAMPFGILPFPRQNSKRHRKQLNKKHGGLPQQPAAALPSSKKKMLQHAHARWKGEGNEHLLAIRLQ
jgi:hypothetical protein